ncbi:4-phosphopantoate--beta-alanine ligase [Methanohalobium sp.]|uniref:4-phosphopantoate--beta-alanine ligase n=2 Tax=Methanohalobium sp. TaxID=2837493 RepID=UPI0025D12F86|nr:4-phosphopantoate--beta-alanine ligase [Methanohalobium sp.]
MTQIPRDHPRYKSLITREMAVEGVKKGITSTQGLIAQGRGEAFDYLIGEYSTESAKEAERVATAHLLLAKKPVISINGNTAALIPDEMVELSDIIKALLEVNLFHRSMDRIDRIIEHMESHGAENVLGRKGDSVLDLSHDRRKVDHEGIYSADVVLVPLEDGDRCEKLSEIDKVVIAIDLNPLSRTSQCADITIVDNITRAFENMLQYADEMKTLNSDKLRKIVDSYDNNRIITSAIDEIITRLNNLSKESGNKCL